jgi:pilus assembly protein CpaF
MTMPGTRPLNEPAANDLQQLKMHLLEQIVRDVDDISGTPDERRQSVNALLMKRYLALKVNLPENQREIIFHEILDEVLGFGKLQPLLDDPEISEVMVNGKRQVFVEKFGILSQTNIEFETDDEIIHIIERIILPLGRRIDPDSPTVDARLPDGSRVNAVVPPVAIDGPLLTIRKFAKNKYSMEQLIQMGTLTENMATFIKACVVSRLNIIISGGTSSGKTTLLNAISSYIPNGDRIVTIEDAAELKLQQNHVVRMEAKMPNAEGKNAVTIRDLVRNSMRMRPDRIVVGEVRGPECLDMLQAMNTGHDGSLTTLHANAPRDVVSRMETMTLMSGIDMPIKVIRSQIASAIDLIIHLSRLKGGQRCITYITEISGMESDVVVMTDIFKFEQTGVDPEGKVVGELKPTGIRPLFTPRLEVNGFKLSPDVFGINIADILRDQNR